MVASPRLLLPLSLLLASTTVTIARPETHQPDSDEVGAAPRQDIQRGLRKLNELAGMKPAERSEQMSKHSFNLSEIMYPLPSVYFGHGIIVPSRANRIYSQSAKGLPFSTTVTTLHEFEAVAAGALRIKAAVLMTDNLLALHLRPHANITFGRADLLLQLEDGTGTSAVRTIKIDTLSRSCPQLGPHLMHVCSGPLTVGPFFIPTFTDKEMDEGMASLHLWMVTDQGVKLADVNIIVAPPQSE